MGWSCELALMICESLVYKAFPAFGQMLLRIVPALFNWLSPAGC